MTRKYSTRSYEPKKRVRLAARTHAFRETQPERAVCTDCKCTRQSDHPKHGIVFFVGDKMTLEIPVCRDKEIAK